MTLILILGGVVLLAVLGVVAYGIATWRGQDR